MSLSLILFIFIPIFLSLYWYLTRSQLIFKVMDIPYEPAYPIVGSLINFVFRRQSGFEFISELTQKYEKYSAFGIVDFRGPRLMIQDPCLIQEISQNHFSSFVNHVPCPFNETDSLIKNSIIFLDNEKWRDMRATLSPAFASNKVRMMFRLLNECAEDFVDYFVQRHRPGRQEIVDAKDIFGKYTIDVISSCGFGITVNSLKNPDNEIYVQGTKALGLGGKLQHLKFLFILKFSKIARLLRMGITTKESKMFFINLVHDTIAHRRATSGFRPDMIQMLMQAIDGSLKHEEDIFFSHNRLLDPEESEIGRKRVYRSWSDAELAAQCFMFYLVAYERPTAALLYIAYELALNRDFQAKLIDEIDTLRNDLDGGKLNYERILRMEYMEAVICETLRLYPIGYLIDRVCGETFTVVDSDGKEIKIEKNMRIGLNYYSLHHNKTFFPDPEKFDPNRFLGENRANIKPGTFLPFSNGPRCCIGARLAMAEIKVLLFHLLSNFTIEVCPGTPIPMTYVQEFTTLLGLKDNVLLELRRRIK